jgi:glycosyltransferase involved in cell wall biosynthesis
MTPDPKVSVVMPVFNGERYLRSSIESILFQTLSDFEFIIIDDGSTDDSPAILDEYSDSRIVVVKNQSNEGIVFSLNRGLERARGKYIARHDADDIALPERLRAQLSFLDSHGDIDVLGTHTYLIDESGEVLQDSSSLPPSDPSIACWLTYFGSQLAHPTVVMRREVYEKLGGYDERFRHAEDYEYWLRVCFSGGRIANLPERHAKQRVHNGRVSKVYSSIQSNVGDLAAHQTIEKNLGHRIDPEKVRQIRNFHRIETGSDALASAELLATLHDNYVSNRSLSTEQRAIIDEDVAERMTNIIIRGLKQEPRIIGQSLRLLRRHSLASTSYKVRRRVLARVTSAALRRASFVTPTPLRNRFE